MNKTNLEPFRAGFVGLLGWTNVGKSTLINQLTGMHIAIIADSPQTTRHRLIGIVQGNRYQIAFIDTPGIHEPRQELSRRMIATTWSTMDNMDAIVWMVFPDKSPEMQFRQFERKIQALTCPVIVAINKVDTIPKDQLLPLLTGFHRITNAEVIPISALTGENLWRLMDLLVTQLPENEPMFPEDQVTDQPERIISAEMIREQAILMTYQEIPHVLNVEVESFKEETERNMITISAVIYVEKISQKGIVIGNQGIMLKKIGTAARMNLEQFFGAKVNLKLWVKVSPNWRNDEPALKRFGFL